MSPIQEPTINRQLYTDIIDAGGLAAVAQDLLLRAGSSLSVAGVPRSPFPLYGRVKREERVSQIYVDPEKRLFLFDVWQNDLIRGTGEGDDLADVITIVDQWAMATCSVSEVEQTHDVRFRRTPETVDPIEAVNRQWERYLSSPPPVGVEELAPFIQLAAQQPILRGLCPVSSMFSFSFSRCSRYPFSQDCPMVTANRRDRYQVHGRNGVGLGIGTAEFAVSLVVRNLPRDCGPAIRGTARKLETDKQ